MLPARLPAAAPPEHPIVINARAAVRAEVTGVERWAREMVARLPALRPTGYLPLAPPVALAHRPGHVWEQVVLPLAAARRRAPLLFSPAQVAPIAFPRNVVIMHDAVALSHPEWYSRAYVACQRALIPRLVRRALAIVTVSEFSRDELIEFAGADTARLEIVPGGVDERFRPDVDPALVRAALGLDRPYVLTVGGHDARKNLPALSVAAARLRPLGVEIVAAGGTRSHFGAAAAAGGVRRLGYVSEDDLPGLYAGAAAFVLPSRHEGFGLPCLEAMASGVPVVAAARGALPETCGDAALLIDPDDREALAGALVSAVTDDALAARLRTAGLARSAERSWNRSARAVDALLARIVDAAL